MSSVKDPWALFAASEAVAKNTAATIVRVDWRTVMALTHGGQERLHHSRARDVEDVMARAMRGWTVRVDGWPGLGDRYSVDAFRTKNAQRSVAKVPPFLLQMDLVEAIGKRTETIRKAEWAIVRLVREHGP